MIVRALSWKNLFWHLSDCLLSIWILPRNLPQIQSLVSVCVKDAKRGWSWSGGKRRELSQNSVSLGNFHDKLKKVWELFGDFLTWRIVWGILGAHVNSDDFRWKTHRNPPSYKRPKHPNYDGFLWGLSKESRQDSREFPKFPIECTW